jgi:hypothetical protein
MGIIYRSWARFVLQPPARCPAPVAYLHGQSRKGPPSIVLEVHTGTLRDECVSIPGSFDYRLEPVSPWPDHGPIAGSFLALPDVAHAVVTVHSVSDEAPSAFTTRTMSSLS